MAETSLTKLWRRMTTFFGVDSIAFAQERRARERAQHDELAALRTEVEDLKRRLTRVEREAGGHP